MSASHGLNRPRFFASLRMTLVIATLTNRQRSKESEIRIVNYTFREAPVVQPRSSTYARFGRESADMRESE